MFPSARGLVCYSVLVFVLFYHKYFKKSKLSSSEFIHEVLRFMLVLLCRAKKLELLPDECDDGEEPSGWRQHV